MLPVTRADLDHICCICLLDIRPSVYTENVYDVKMENLSKMLKLSAHITILKNPKNEKYIDDYCRKICEVCFVKVQFSYVFREKIMASTTTLKELLESSDLSEVDIERLQFFCRICLNRQAGKNTHYLNMIYLNWMKACTGIRFTTLIDTDTFRIKEGTNINEIALIDDTHFPKQLCVNCFKKLQNVEDFRKSATQSFEYMISVMGDAVMPEDYLMTQEVKHFAEDLIPRGESHIQQQQQNCVADIEQYSIYESICKIESVVTTSPFSDIEKFEPDETVEDGLELKGTFPHYSDNNIEDFPSNFNYNTYSDNSSMEYKFLGNTPTKNKEKRNVVNNRNVLETRKEHFESKNRFKTKLRCYQSRNQSESGHESDNSLKNTKQKLKKIETSQSVSIKNNEDDDVKETLACEECSKTFSTRRAYKKHQRNVHSSDPNRTINECLICSKIFKRKSHLTDHIKTVHEKLRPFKCSYCTKTLSTSSSRRVHELSHTGDYPFVCKWCGKLFRQPSQLKVHSEIHTTSPELLCPICKRSQKSQNDLENHLKSHKDKRLQCPLCGKFFTRNYHLKDHHNAVHLKLRPFKCKFCELAFGDRKTRTSHEKSHTEDRSIMCGVCKSGFRTNYALSKHMNQFGHKSENVESKNKIKKNTAKSIISHGTKELHSVFELNFN